MANLEGSAKRLHERLNSLGEEIGNTKSRLREKQKEKQEQLLKGDSVDVLNEELAKLKQKIEDQGFVTDKLTEELQLTGEKLKEKHLGEIQKKLAGIKTEIAKYQEQIKLRHAEIQKLKAVISLSSPYLDGRAIEIPPEQNLALQTLLAETEVEELKAKNAKDFLAELGIALPEEQREKTEAEIEKEEESRLEEELNQARIKAEEAEEAHQRRMAAEEVEPEIQESVFD